MTLTNVGKLTPLKFNLPASLPAWRLSVLVILFLGACMVNGQTALQERIASYGGVVEYRLPNGLRVVVVQDEAAATVTVATLYLTGSRAEVPGQHGIAHLLEHLMFTGTEKHPNLLAEFGSRGASTNATTSQDRTLFYQTLPWSESNLSWALDVESDRMVNVKFTLEHLAKERAAVQQEASATADPRRSLYEAVLSTAYQWHNYAHSPIGTRADVEAITPTLLEEFYRKYYRPSNAVLIVSSPLSPSILIERVRASFGGIPVNTPPPVISSTAEPAQAGERSFVLRVPGGPPTVMFGFHVPSASHPELASIEVAAELLFGRGGVLSSSLTSASHYELLRLHDPGMLIVTAPLPTQNPEAAADDLERKLDAVLTQAPAREGVTDAKNSTALGFANSGLSASRLVLDIAEWVAAGDWRLMFAYRDALNRVDENSVKAAFRYFKSENRSRGILLPVTPEHIAVNVPSAPAIDGLIAVYDERSSPARTRPTSPNSPTVTTGALRNGLKYVFRAQPNAGNTASAQLFLHFGSAESLRTMRAVGDVAARAVSNSLRTASVTAQLADLGMTANMSGTAYSFFVSLQGPGEHMDAALEIVSKVLKAPDFNVDSLERARVDVAQQSQSSDLYSDLMRELRQALAQWPADHVLYEGPVEQRAAAIRAVKDSEVNHYYRNFYGASAAEFVATGSINPERLRAAAEKSFGEWKSQTPFAPFSPPAFAGSPRDISIASPGERGIVLAAIPLSISPESPEYAALLVANQLLGGGFYGAVLPARIRGIAGAAYRVSSMVYSGTWGADRQAFVITVMCSASAVPQVIGLIREAMSDVADHGRPAEEIAAARDGLLQARHVNRARDTVWLSATEQDLFFHRSLDYDDRLDEAIPQVTPEDVRNILFQYLKPQQIWFVSTTQ